MVQSEAHIFSSHLRGLRPFHKSRHKTPALYHHSGFQGNELATIFTTNFGKPKKTDF